MASLCLFQLMLRIGKDWEAEHSPSKIVEEYIGQHHGFQRETDFVATVVHEDNEGKAFWKCFKLQVITWSMSTCSGVLNVQWSR